MIPPISVIQSSHRHGNHEENRASAPDSVRWVLVIIPLAVVPSLVAIMSHECSSMLLACSWTIVFQFCSCLGGCSNNLCCLPPLQLKTGSSFIQTPGSYHLRPAHVPTCINLHIIQLGYRSPSGSPTKIDYRKKWVLLFEPLLLFAAIAGCGK